MERILLRLTTASTASWCLENTPGRISQGALEAAGQAGAGGHAVVLVPTSAVSLVAAQIPTRQRQRLRQALPYALEEQLAADVETLHFAIAARYDGDEVPCAVVDRATLRGWLDDLQAAGLVADVMLPDVLALPRADDAWSVLIEDEAVLLRHGDMRGLACDSGTLPHLLPLLLQQSGIQRPTRLQLFAATTDGATQQMLHDWCAAEGIELQHTPLNGNALSMLAAPALRNSSLNLLQGEFSRREKTRQLWRPWRAAAALLLAFLLLQGGMAAARYRSLAQQDEQLATQIEQVYRTTFPESQRVVNAPVQMEQKLKELRTGATAQEFHRLMLHTAPALQTPGITLRALHYSSGLLDIEVSASDLQALDKLKEALGSDGMRAEISGADSSGNTVAGRIALRGEKR